MEDKAQNEVAPQSSELKCAHCGTKLPQVTYRCTKCGYRVCKKCGEGNCPKP